VSTLRSGLDELRSSDVAALSDDELHEDLRELERASRVIESGRARRIAEADRRRSYAGDGHVSMAAWLRHRLGVAGSTASEQLRLARSLAAMPEAGAAFSDGDLGASAVSLLASAYRADPLEYGRAEKMLVELARSLPVRDLRRAIERWRQLADAAHEDAAAERRYERRGLHVSPMLDGMVRVDGELDPETGQTVVTALRSMQDAWARSSGIDLRTPAQRRADALGEICRRYLDSPERPSIAGERPHVTVTVDLEALEGRAGRRCELDDAGRIPADAVRRLACDASVSRVVLDPRSEPLDLGRRTPVVPASLRRAVVVRDGGCRFPGCDRPQSWCDAHHILHWADGGETSLANLVLLCRPHHRRLHRGFAVRRSDDRFVFRRPDGTVLDDRAPPGSSAVA
jgi:uncharacterized protein DUF222/HNH endonuclease